MCLVYAASIADRYVVTTVMEPMRLDLHLSDSGVVFLTGPPLALFYVTLGIPIAWLADNSNRRMGLDPSSRSRTAAAVPR